MLSPLLYAIQALVLSLQLEQSRKDQELIGIRMAHETKDINHAQFADDTILLGGATHNIARRFKAELDSYCQASGSKLNLRKSKIYSWNINHALGYIKLGSCPTPPLDRMVSFGLSRGDG